MFVCGYHFPASEGNDIAFDKVIEKVEEGTEAAGKTVTLTSETREGAKLEEISVPEGSFLHTAFVDYFNNTEVAEKTVSRWFTTPISIKSVRFQSRLMVKRPKSFAKNSTI